MMHRSLIFLFCLLAWLAAAVPGALANCGSNPGTCYWRGAAAGNWSTAANWSDTGSGGAAQGGAGPAANDTVVFDSGSAAASTISAAIAVLNIDTTGGSGGNGSAYTGTITQNTGQTLTMTCNGASILKIASVTTWTPVTATSGITYGGAGTCTGTGTLTINMNSGGAAGTFHNNFGNFTVNAATTSTVVPADAFRTLATAGINLTQGILDFSVNNVNVSTGAMAATGTLTRTLSCGSGAWTFNPSTTANVIDFTNVTGLTWNPGTCAMTINVTTVQGVSVAWQGGAKVFTNVTFVGNGTGNRFQIAGSPTFTNLSYTPGTGGIWFAIASGTNLTITNNIALAGTASSPILITTDAAAGVAATLTVNGLTNTCTWCIINSITAAAHTITATNSLSLGQANGTWSISPPGGGGGGHVIGGYLLRRDLAPNNDNAPAFVRKAS
jgi:hypothetical protein